MAIAAVAGNICLLLGNLGIIRFYGQPVHDRVVLVFSAAWLLMVLSDLGLASKAGVRAIARRRSTEPQTLGKLLSGLMVVQAAAGVLLAAGMIALAGPVSAMWADVQASSVRLAGTWVAAFVVMRVAVMTAVGFERMADVLVINPTAEVAKLTWVVVCGLAGLEVEWVFVGWTGAYALAAVVAVGRMRGLLRRFGVHLRAVTAREALGLARSALPYYVSHLGLFGLAPAVQLMIGLWRGSAEGQTSIFQVCFSLALMSRLVSIPVSTALLPRVAWTDASAEAGHEDTSAVLRQIVRLLALVGTFVFAACWALGGSVLGALYGAQYGAHLSVLLVAALAVGLEGYTQQLDQILMAMHDAPVVARTEGLKYLLLLGGAVLLVPEYKALGGAAAVCVAMVGSGAVKMIATRKRVGAIGGVAMACSLITCAIVTGVSLLPSGAVLAVPAWLAAVLGLRLLRPRELGRLVGLLWSEVRLRRQR